MEKIKGVLYCWFWITSILAGYAGLFCPLLPIIFISNRLYRYCTDFLFTFWQQYPTALLQFLCQCEVVVTGDALRPQETSVLVMNHRTRTDWNFLWPAAFHATSTSNPNVSVHLYPLKFILKDAIRHIPGPGWVMQLSCFVYIRRSWICDKLRLEQLVSYFLQLKYKYSMLIFPEGTDLTSHTQQASHRYACKNNLQKYDYVLHPRTKGFTYLCEQLLSRDALDSIFDITLLYPDRVPQTEKHIAQGLFPKVIRMHFQRYHKSVLPKTETGLKQFLEEKWQKKEENLKNYHDTGRFLTGKQLVRNAKYSLMFAAIFWTLLPLIVLLSLLYFPMFRALVVSHTIFLVILNYFTCGFQDFEIGIYNLKRKFIKNPW